MRVLHVNKFADIVGGVEMHVHRLMFLQQESGMDVDLFSADDVRGESFDRNPRGTRRRMKQAAHLLWSEPARSALERRIRAFSPDVVHFHGVYHHLSPSVLWASRRLRSANVMTLHDYKLSAPCYLLFRDGRACTECVGRTIPIRAIQHKCVTESRSASLLCSVEQAMHRPVYNGLVDKFIVPSEYAKDVFLAANSRRCEDVLVVPHGVPTGLSGGSKEEGRVVFAGRLSPEKGVLEMLEAWRLARLPAPWALTVAGEGRLLEAARQFASDRVSIVGGLSTHAVAEAFASAEVALVPSLGPETFGLSAAEAMAAGCCVIGTRVGNLPHLLDGAGVLVTPGDVAELAEALRRVAGSSELRATLARRSRLRAEEKFQEAAMLEGTLAAYRGALGARANRRSGLFAAS